MRYISLITLLLSLIPHTAFAGQKIDFNRGWQTFTISFDDAAAAFGNRTRMDSKDWKVVRVSSEETKEAPNDAAKAFDNDPGTFWHTRYSDQRDAYPHELVIDLGKRAKASAFYYRPRPGIGNGRVKEFAVYLSDKQDDWAAPVAQGTLTGKDGVQVVDFQEAKSGRYLRFVALSSINKQPFGGAAELGLLDASEKILGTTWESQFTTEHADRSQTLAPMTDEDLAKLRDAFTKADWKPVTLPATAIIEPREIASPKKVLAFYRKTFIAPKDWENQRVAIEFEGVMQVSDYWLNGQHIHFQAGGYMGFVIDLTGKLKLGEENELIVRADNREHPLVPPGKPVGSLDFCYHSGIYRDAYLHVTDPLHITHELQSDTTAGGGVFVTYPKVSDELATVQVKVQVANGRKTAANATVQCAIDDTHASSPIALAPGETKDVTLQLDINHPKLWHPDSPNLCTLKTTLQLDGQTVDARDTRIGIRSFTVSKAEGLKINGKPFTFTGANRHQEYPWIGNAVPNNANYRDAWLMKQAGFNFVRLSHYPQDPSFYDACDELGLLIADAIPGWQFYNRNPEFISRVERDCREMIRRDRNHPSVLLWEVSLNESYPPVAFCNHLVDIAHEEFPGCLTTGDTYHAKPTNPTKYDVPHTTFMEKGGYMPRPILAQPDSPAYSREYGDYEFGGGQSTTRQRRGAGEDALLTSCWNFYWEHNQELKDKPWKVGDCIWVMFDHNRGVEAKVSACGAADLLRLPKFSYYFFQSQRDASSPMVYIANYWTKRDGAGKVVVFSNADEVELFVNGKSIARQKPDAGPDTPHIQFARNQNLQRWDGGNANQLTHPAFTFMNVTYAPGALKAVAYRNGKVVAEQSVYTPGAPAKIKLAIDTCNRPISQDRKDAVFVRAEILDVDNHPIPDARVPVEFKVTGAELASPSTVDAEAGIATALIVTPGEGKPIVITASSLGMETATVTVP